MKEEEIEYLLFLFTLSVTSANYQYNDKRSYDFFLLLEINRI
jgi:hypothetical protein